MDETYLLAAAKYIEMNPVRAGLVSDPYEARKGARIYFSGEGG